VDDSFANGRLLLVQRCLNGKRRERAQEPPEVLKRIAQTEPLASRNADPVEAPPVNLIRRPEDHRRVDDPLYRWYRLRAGWAPTGSL
jgi:hypothetical protein